MKINGLNFQVIAVQDKKGSGILEIGGNPDRRVLIPYNTFAKLFQALRPSVTISVKGYETDKNLENLEGEIRGLMRARRSLKPTQDDNFAINRPEAPVPRSGTRLSWRRSRQSAGLTCRWISWTAKR